jgi:murein DD-endopeptidase MepM/ murein hydrolase activator NlpD
LENSISEILQLNSSVFHPVVPFDPSLDTLVQLDFTEKNKELTMEVVKNTQDFTGYINHQLAVHNAKFGIGGYDEYRNIYQRSSVFGDVNSSEEPRRLHLGMDIWGKPHTAVMAPMDALVHSFAFNNEFGDYGATIILTHLLNGITFYTLYGHLSLNSIKNLKEGQRVRKGDVIGGFGIQAENGSWPPHLHFQIITDLENNKGDYPGVCRLSDKEKYLSRCPDPDLILHLNQFI